MSRSRRLAIIKDRPRNFKKSTHYWRTVRAVTNNVIRSCKDFENLLIPDPKSIINDYDYCDYMFMIQYESYTRRSHEEWLADKKKYSRK